jgi:hypothetical protein
MPRFYFTRFRGGVKFCYKMNFVLAYFFYVFWWWLFSCPVAAWGVASAWVVGFCDMTIMHDDVVKIQYA